MFGRGKAQDPEPTLEEAVARLLTEDPALASVPWTLMGYDFVWPVAGPGNHAGFWVGTKQDDSGQTVACRERWVATGADAYWRLRRFRDSVDADVRALAFTIRARRDSPGSPVVVTAASWGAAAQNT